MASIDSPPIPPRDDQAAWNEAYDRLRHFLDSFGLGDHTQVPRLALHLLEEARALHRQEPARAPVTVTMENAQKRLAEWLGGNLEVKDKNPSQVFSSGYLAFLLSKRLRATPDVLLASPLLAELREEMRGTLLVTGPDLNISSMTPRHLDYGPMLGLARSTWHRWNVREILVAVLFWSGVYFVFYWWLSELL